MSFVCLHDPDEIARFAARDPLLHIYSVGDLDPFFWPHTTWYGARGSDGELEALCLLYTGMSLPTLLALGRDDAGALPRLVAALRRVLPRRFYAHLSPGVRDALGNGWRQEPHGRFLKMGLAEPSRLATVDTSGVERLGPEHLPELDALYARAYPGNWFDPRMLETGCYFGVREGGALVCAAGIHVYSPRYSVAALGNITTAPERRGRGLARRATARLCVALRETIDGIGLNVKADNAAAIACYRRLGFTEVAPYEELTLSPPG